LIPKELLPDFKAELEQIKEMNVTDKGKEQLIKEYDKKIMLLEERRLCYVAWTRAKKELILTYALDYKGEPNSTIQSEFLNEINYLENENVDFVKDEKELSMLLAHQSPYENELSKLKAQIISALDTDSYEDLQKRLATYVSCKEKSPVEGIKEEDIKEILSKSKEESIITFDPSSVTFSPTAISSYAECPKQYELNKIYQMPQRGDFENTGEGLVIGSFIHKVCEVGVNRKLNSLQEFKDLARELHVADFKTTKLDEADIMLEVFWERNKNKITEKSVTEMKLSFNLEGFRFFGIADRVDTLKDGTAEIVDYKTNKSAIAPEKRALQLGFYALALQEKGYKVSKLTLDMLRLDKPIEMAVDEEGNVTAVTGCTKTSNFSLIDLKKKIIDYCKAIAHDYEHGFKVAEEESACRFCGYKFYCPKWEEK
jgi:DNA helicase-2/ATP-dependent DNA helicase PcrA